MSGDSEWTLDSMVWTELFREISDIFFSIFELELNGITSD